MMEAQAIYNVSVTPAPVFTEASSPTAFGIDVSKWQGEIDYHQCESDGVKFAAIRCTVGDYYTDERFAENWEGFGSTNILRMPYLVVAPAWSPEYGYHPVGSQAHWERFKKAFGDRKPELPIVLDCELSRGMSPDYISDLIVDLAWLIHDEYGRMPIIYTRGNWWNENTTTRTIFGLCDLWIARYNIYLSSPWSDNEIYRPRDWQDWHFWQWSEEEQIDGIPNANVDADWFNGTLEELLTYADSPATPEPEPEPQMEFCKVNPRIESVNLRSGPGIQYHAVGRLYPKYVNDVWFPILEDHAVNDDMWFRIGTGIWVAYKWRSPSSGNLYTFMEVV